MDGTVCRTSVLCFFFTEDKNEDKNAMMGNG